MLQLQIRKLHRVACHVVSHKSVKMNLPVHILFKHKSDILNDVNVYHWYGHIDVKDTLLLHSNIYIIICIFITPVLIYSSF